MRSKHDTQTPRATRNSRIPDSASPPTDISPGKPELIARIADRIAQHGPIDFAAYMEMALYDRNHGYYELEESIGWRGDFYTSEDLDVIYGETIGRQLYEASLLIAPDRPVTIVEMGPGRGALCRDVLAFLERDVPEVRSRIRYVLVERSARMIRRQRELLQPFLSMGWRVSWRRGLDAFLPAGIEGVIFSNELVDAFPVHRVVMRNGLLKECFVSYRHNAFVEIENTPLPAVADYVQRFIVAYGIVLKEGMRAEINLEAVKWVQSVAGVLKKGIAVTIDYGYPAHELYGSHRPHGTLLCYVRHRVCDSPYVGVGHHDMTAHVNFSALASAGRDVGLEVTGFTNQQSFLLGLGIADKATESNQALIAQLIHPDGLGRTHKVLVQHVGMPAPTLSGLKYRPFFDASLLAE